ncbi:hypothetical protein [Streptomyces sp. NPDC048637]|uniref:hypothetical protein n=1 Tax=Streptomyces sp. NPDC048637 TaxID=3155636 RepID=UPI00343EFD2F
MSRRRRQLALFKGEFTQNSAYGGAVVGWLARRLPSTSSAHPRPATMVCPRHDLASVISW